MSSHFMVQCEAHGTVLQQCRCPGVKVISTVPCPGKPGCDGHLRPWKLPEEVVAEEVAQPHAKAALDRYREALEAIVHEDPTDRYDGAYCHYCEGQPVLVPREDPMELADHETVCPYRIAVEALG